MAGPGASRRYIIILLTASALAGYLFVSIFRGHPPGTHAPQQLAFSQSHGPGGAAAPAPAAAAAAEPLHGHPIMPKLGNETAKAELGRATWKYFHTVMARFPDHPTADESAALKSYVHLFQRLYPCGECSEHFGAVLERFPPQTSSRSAAAVWACHVHNEVNKSLGKEAFDCAKIGDFYDCGCAEDGDAKGTERAEGETPSGKASISKERLEEISGTNGRDFNMDLLKGDRVLQAEKEG